MGLLEHDVLCNGLLAVGSVVKHPAGLCSLCAAKYTMSITGARLNYGCQCGVEFWTCISLEACICKIVHAHCPTHLVAHTYAPCCQDKDGVSAAAVFAEMAASHYSRGVTVAEHLQELYRR
eukprot:GHRR01012150.1.p2 GENE.GHRR01012150.1~~GHRR01012150.1.p2  ORF type:complete len:121 (-),score=22.86 GHRR01012150.1:1535-1897(-)